MTTLSMMKSSILPSAPPLVLRDSIRRTFPASRRLMVALDKQDVPVPGISEKGSPGVRRTPECHSPEKCCVGG